MLKSTKKVTALLLVAIMSLGLFMSVNVKADSTITVSVKIRTTTLNGGVLVSNSSVELPSGSKAMAALKAVSGGTTATTTTVGGTTYYTQGILKWYTTSWGDYISAVQVSGHSSSNKYFGNNGTASSWSGSSQSSYAYLTSLNDTEYNDLGYAYNATFNNTVHEDGYLSETDYNRFSGWMTVINGSTNNNGVSTVLSDGDQIDLNFSMMMGLDLGQSSWVQDSDGEWVQCSAWHNNYSFTNNTW